MRAVIFLLSAHSLLYMKRKLTAIIAVMIICMLFLPACDAVKQSSVKALTRPYIAQYECVQAKLGEEDILEKFDYIRITLADKDTMIIAYKPKKGEKKQFKCNYTFDWETKEITADISIFGCKVKEKTTVQNGSFSIVKQIGNKTFAITFKAQ